ncbi:MAG TPA: hypothetical protein VIG72_15040 [Pontibacter sp.]
MLLVQPTPTPPERGLSAFAIVENYSTIVTDQERTGRDLSLLNYYHEKGYVTIAAPTIGKQLLSR